MLSVAMAQIEPRVGDIGGNVDRILDAWHRAAEQGADLVAFPELAVTGYPPEDLLLKPAFVAAAVAALDRLAAEGPPATAAVVGHVSEADPDQTGAAWLATVPARNLRNSASVIAEGRVLGTYHKWQLPNYGVFDEARYFVSDQRLLVLDLAGTTVGVTICEDLWVPEGPVTETAAAGAEVLVNLNASPYERGVGDVREARVRHHATQDGLHVVYVNQVGGQDDVVFDGGSLAMAPDGTVLARGRQYEPDLPVVELPVGTDDGRPARRGPLPEPLDPVAEVWGALVLGTRDYVRRNGFDAAVVGLSGGIDSAVTCAVAADALGPGNVVGVAMPSPHSSPASLADARALADNLGIDLQVVEITPAMAAYDDILADVLAGTEPDTTEENLQARIRGAVLMAISNKLGPMVLATGNKSEYAVGYATLYGDMVGGFAVLKDVPKTLVYELAAHRNRRGTAIPQRTLDRAPSAELRPDQRDTDSLPPYAVLDPIIEGYVGRDATAEDLVAAGHDRAVVEQVLPLIDRAEFKRRQAPPGVKVTGRAFGKERRVPITNAWAPPT